MNDIAFSPEQNGLVRPGATEPTAPAAPTSPPVLARYLRIASRRKWLIMAAVAICLLAGILITLLATPQYTATTRLEISREGSRVVNVEGVEPETSAIDNEFYQTQYALLQSKSLAERVARELRLADDPKFFALFGREDVLEPSTNGVGGGASRDERTRIAGRLLLDNLRISPLRMSRLVDVSWTSPDAAFSARVTNAWAQAFIEASLERRFDATSYARQFLEQRLEQLRRRLEESERQLVGYAANEQLINIPVVTGSETGTTTERSLTADSMVALNAALDEASAERIRAQSRLTGAGGPSAEAVNNQTLSSLRARRSEAAAEYSRMMSQFQPDYPPARALNAQIQQLDESIGREENRVRDSLVSAYRDSVQRERLLSQRFETLKSSFLDQKRRSIQYNIFQREVDTNRELYNGLLQRYKEIGVAGGVGNNNIAVVDSAEVPVTPAYPRPLINLIVALGAGLIAGVGLALVREQIDESVTDPAEVEDQIGLPLLGAVPATRGSNPREELHDPKSGLTESYLSVQSSLTFASTHGLPRSLVVTSSRPGEGKSTTAHALAYSLGRSGLRTVLVDGDMRSPSVHAEIGLPNERGLSNYLAGDEQANALVQRPEGEPYVILAAGPQPPNAAELLRGPKFAMLVAELLESFDHVVIDSPPVMGLADAPLLASHAEGTVFVIEAGGVKARVARGAVDRLRQARATLIGTVLTKFDSRHAPLTYGYEYGYGYGADIKYGEKKDRGGKKVW